MLTKQDLETAVSGLQKEIIKSSSSLSEDVKQIIQKEVSPIRKDIQTIKKDITQIRASQNEIINFFEREYLELRQRIERIEEHLGITS